MVPKKQKWNHSAHRSVCVLEIVTHSTHTYSHRLALPRLLLISRLLLQCSDPELKLIQTEPHQKPPRLRVPDTDLQHRLPLPHLV